MPPDFIDSNRYRRVTVTTLDSVTGLFSAFLTLPPDRAYKKNLYAFNFKFDTTHPAPYLLQHFLASVTLIL